MIKAINDIKKPRGRPKTTGTGEPVMVRLQPTQLKQLDEWISKNDKALSRPEAIRRLLNDRLGG